MNWLVKWAFAASERPQVYLQHHELWSIKIPEASDDLIIYNSEIVFNY